MQGVHREFLDLAYLVKYYSDSPEELKQGNIFTDI